MKKIFSIIIMSFAIFCSVSAMAANIVVDENFDDYAVGDTPRASDYIIYNNNISVYKDADGLNYIDSTSDPVSFAVKTASDVTMVTMRVKYISNGSQWQIWNSGTLNAWNDKLFHPYNPVNDNGKAWHQTTVIVDCANSKGYIYIDGKLKSSPTMPATINGLHYNGYNVEVNNIKVVHTDLDGAFEISSLKFNDMEYKADDKNNFGTLPFDTNKVSVMLDMPIKSDYSQEPFVLLEDGEAVSISSTLQSSGYYDIEYAFKNGVTYTLKLAEGLATDFGTFKNEEYTFTLAGDAYEFGTPVITTDIVTKGEISIKNNTFATFSGTLLLFVYDADGNMVDCIASDKTDIGSTKSGTIQVQLDKTYDNSYTVSAYLWDDAYSAIPIISAE